MNASAPMPSPAANPPPARAVADFTGRIEPTKVSTAYKFGLAATAFGMVLLSAIYIGLILLATFGVYYHLRHHTALFEGDRVNLFTMFVYFAPAVAGVIL